MQSKNSSVVLLPIKFVILVAQVLLLVVALLERDNHIYFEVGENYSESSAEYLGAEKTFLGISYTFIALCLLEFIFMIVGTSVPPIFAEFTFLQIILHFLGSLFTIWFILDSWNYTLMWPIFVLFSIIPIIIEGTILQQGIRMNKDIRNTRDGILKIAK